MALRPPLPRAAASPGCSLLRLALVAVALVAMLLPPSLAATEAGRRMALVVGNDAYAAITPLDNAGNDARSMAGELRGLGFQVSEHFNIGYTAMVEAVDRFVTGLAPGDDVVVFFSGHGVQIPRIGSYLLPTDVSVGNVARLERTAYSLEFLASQLTAALPRFNLIVVDACRDNPFMSKSVGSGFSGVEPARGQMIVFSASKNQPALDRLGSSDRSLNGVFTRELLRVMKRPELSIQEVMLQVQDRVETLAQSIGREQRPAIYSEVRGRFFLHAQAAPSPVRSEAPDPEAEAWAAIKNSRAIEDFEDYLRTFPNGRYATAARANIRRLRDEAARRPPEPPAPRAVPAASAPSSAAAAGAPPGRPPAPAEPAPRRGDFVPPAN